MNSKLDELLGFHQTALNIRAYRQQLIASNIANADTPNYKAKDVDFQAALQGAINKATPSQGLATTNPNHIRSTSATGVIDLPIKYRTVDQPSVDGNTVNMDVERSAFAENALQMEALISFVNHRFRLMQSAVQGQ